MLSGQSVPSGTAASIVVNTHKGNAAGLSSMASSSFATINQRMQGKLPPPLKVQVQTVSISTNLCFYSAPFSALKLNCFKDIAVYYSFCFWLECFFSWCVSNKSVTGSAKTSKQPSNLRFCNCNNSWSYNKLEYSVICKCSKSGKLQDI